MTNQFNLFQIATGKETTINTLYHMIKKEMEQHEYTVSMPIYEHVRKGEIYRNYTDISKAEKVLGYLPSISLAEGITETVEWFIQRNPYGP
jgi:nucleoside-diphosphate-sugar epimerase